MATKKKKSANAAHPAVKKTSAPAKSDFWSVEFNLNSLYWLAIGLAVIATAVLTYNTNQNVNDIYDSIDAANFEAENSGAKPADTKPKPQL